MVIGIYINNNGYWYIHKTLNNSYCVLQIICNLDYYMRNKNIEFELKHVRSRLKNYGYNIDWVPSNYNGSLSMDSYATHKVKWIKCQIWTD